MTQEECILKGALRAWGRLLVTLAGVGAVLGLSDCIRSLFVYNSPLVPQAWFEAVLNYAAVWTICGGA